MKNNSIILAYLCVVIIMATSCSQEYEYSKKKSTLPKPHTRQSDPLKNSERLYEKGKGDLETGKTKEAINSFTQALQLNTDADIYNSRGFAYIHLGEFKKAIQDFDKAIEHDPTSVASYFNRGHVSLKEKNYEKSYKDFDTVIKLKPKDDTIALAHAYRYRAITGYWTSRYEHIIEDLQKAKKFTTERYENKLDMKIILYNIAYVEEVWVKEKWIILNASKARQTREKIEKIFTTMFTNIAWYTEQLLASYEKDKENYENLPQEEKYKGKRKGQPGLIRSNIEVLDSIIRSFLEPIQYLGNLTLLAQIVKKNIHTMSEDKILLEAERSLVKMMLDKVTKKEEEIQKEAKNLAKIVEKASKKKAQLLQSLDAKEGKVVKVNNDEF